MMSIVHAALLFLLIGGSLAKAGETATAVATVTVGLVSGITVTSGGAGYTTEPAVTLAGGGGTGATARAVLNGDRVASIVVLSAGSGYAAAPTVSIQPPQDLLAIQLDLVPKITLRGLAGTRAVVEWASQLGGPWNEWTNVLVGAQGTVLVDLTTSAASKYYRAVAASEPVRPRNFAWIPPGTFVMGSPTTEAGRSAWETQRSITLSKGFWMCVHEVTQAEFEDIMGYNPAHFRSVDRPVEQVTWTQAAAYCERLTTRERARGRIQGNQAFRLPTEAEWEYAARAGASGATYGPLDAIAWWEGNSAGGTSPVMQKQPNAWGLHDMLGNVWEWCQDWFGGYAPGSEIDPRGPSSGDSRVQRGGGFESPTYNCRLAKRSSVGPTSENKTMGFRVVLAP